MAFNVSYIYQIVDRYSGRLRRIQRATRSFTQGANRARAAVGRFSTSMANLRGIASAAAVGMATAFPIKKAMDFEYAMADVLKVLDDITPAQFKALKKEMFATAIELGRLPVGISAIVTEGAKLGVPINRLGEFTRLATKTAVAFDIVDKEAGRALGTIKDKLALSIKETTHLMDAVNYIGDKSPAQVAGMIEIIERLSGTMMTIKMPPELIAGWAGLANRIEVTPRLAASGMKMMLNKMKLMPGMMGKLLAAPSETIVEYIKQLTKIPERIRPKKIERIFGTEAGGFVEKLVGKIHLLDGALGLVANKTKFAGSMQRELEKKMSTATFKVKQAKSVFEVLAITIGTPLLSAIKKASFFIIKIGKKLAVFAEAHPALSKFLLLLGIAVTAFTGLAIAIGVMAALFSGMAAPLLIAYGAIAALVGIFVLLRSKFGQTIIQNKKVRAAFSKLWNAVKILLEPFKILWGLISSVFDLILPGIGKMDKMAIFVDVLTTAINALAAALKFILSPLQAVMDFGKHLFKGNLKGAFGASFKALKEGALGILPEFMGGTFEGPGVAARNATAFNGTLNGSIDLITLGGARVKRAEMQTNFPGNLGFNMAPAGG